MPRKLNTWVHVGETRYGPDDAVPDEVAEKITNPDVWADDSDTAEKAGENLVTGGRPRGNASREEWAAYALSRGVAVDDGMTRDDIKAAAQG